MIGFHPGIPDVAPLNNAVLGQPLSTPASTGYKLAVFQSSLLPHSGTSLGVDEAVELALDSLHVATLRGGKLPVKGIGTFSPVLLKVDAMVPDKVHLFFHVLRPGRSSAISPGARCVCGTVKVFVSIVHRAIVQAKRQMKVSWQNIWLCLLWRVQQCADGHWCFGSQHGEGILPGILGKEKKVYTQR
jgi:hypothetical protein